MVNRGSTSEAQAISSNGLIKKCSLKERSIEKMQQMLDFRNANSPANYFLKGLAKYPVCQSCLRTGNVIRCAGICSNYFHKHCLKNDTKKSDYSIVLKEKMQNDKQVPSFAGSHSKIEKNTLNLKCVPCETSTSSSINCFVCKKSDNNCTKCDYKNCGRAYHIDCLKYWPQHKKTYKNNSIESLHCPCHVRHTCVSPDIQSLFHKTESDLKLIKCMLCPGTYHRSLKCIPAGSELLSQTQLICARHQIKREKLININHCLFCSQGGSLICCDTCVYSFHEDCLPIPVGNHFSCEVIPICYLIKCLIYFLHIL